MTGSVETEAMQGEGSGASPALNPFGGRGSSKSEMLTTLWEQFESRLHRSAKKPTVHIWIDEVSDMDKAVLETLERKRAVAEQAIREQVKRNMSK